MARLHNKTIGKLAVVALPTFARSYWEQFTGQQ